MSVTKNVFRLNDVYDLVNSGQWIQYDTSPDPGTLWTWGWAAGGTLGDGTVVPKSSPVQVPGTQWLKIAASNCTNLAIKNDNTLWVWGDNSVGEFGNGTYGPPGRSSPGAIPGSQWRSITAGSHILATKTDGTLWAWGCGSQGTLGNNLYSHRSTPVQVPGNSWNEIRASRLRHSMATKTDGTLWMWGEGSRGTLGNNTNDHRSSPSQVPGNTWRSIAVGASSNASRALATKNDGTLWSWGDNGSGALGIGNETQRSSPTQIPGTQWTKVSVAGYEGHALKTDGTLWGWGRNDYGAIGDSTVICKQTPVQIPGTQWNDISSAGSNSRVLARKTDGTLWTWGRGDLGQNGDGCINCRSSPVQIPGTQWTDACAGQNFSIARKTS